MCNTNTCVSSVIFMSISHYSFAASAVERLSFSSQRWVHAVVTSNMTQRSNTAAAKYWLGYQLKTLAALIRPTTPRVRFVLISLIKCISLFLSYFYLTVHRLL